MTNSPFHDPQDNPLPDANEIEQTVGRDIELYSLNKAVDTRGPSPQIKQDIRRLRNAFIGLLVIGAAIGCVLSIIAAILLKRYGFVDPPKSRQESMYIQPHISWVVGSASTSRLSDSSLSARLEPTFSD